FFFFQAEDGIRDLIVTGVQTCALPIFCGPGCADRSSCEHLPDATAGSCPAPAGLAFDRWCRAYRSRPADGRVDVIDDLAPGPARSEERRVGIEGRAGAVGGQRSRQPAR